MDINYEVGVIKAQNVALKESLDDLTTNVSKLTNKVDSMETQLNTWRSTAAGAIVVLSAIGAVVLWMSDSLISIVKLKLGL